MKTYRTITWVVDDEGRMVPPGGLAKLGDDTFGKIAFSVQPEPVEDRAAEAEAAKQAAEAEAAKQAAEADAAKQAAEAEAARQAASAASQVPARKEPEAKPTVAKGAAGKGSK